MNGKITADTTACVAALRGDAALRAKLDEANRVLLPIPALGELFHGALASSMVQENLRSVREFAAGCEIVVCDEAVAEVYAGIRQNLRAQGRPIPENDIWIAACALAQESRLLTSDDHFRWISELTVERF